MSIPADFDAAKAVIEIKRALTDSQNAADVQARAIEGMKADLAAAKRASDEAALAALARPTGKDADVTRAYCVAPEERRRGVEVSSLRSADWSRTHTHVVKDGVGAVRMVTEIDEVGDAHYGLLDDPRPRSEWQADLQQAVALRALGRLCARSTPILDRRVSRLLRSGPGEISRMFADNAGEGAEFLPTVAGALLDRYSALPRAVASLFDVATIGSVDVVNPFVSRGAVPKLVGVPAAADNNPATVSVGNPETSSRTMTAATMAVNILASLDAAEDSIIAFGPWALQEVAIGLADGYEDCIINGDTTTTHQDTIASWTAGSRWPSTGMGGADDHRRSFKGLRKLAHQSSASSDGSGADTIAGAIAQRLTLTGAHRSGDLVYLTNLANLIAKLLTDTNFLTMDKAGQLATILTGQIGAIGGNPVVISEFLTEDTNASGIYDGATTTYTGMLLVNRAQFKRVLRRGPTTELSRQPWAHAAYLTGTARQGFFDVQGVSSTTKTVSYRYKLGKT